MKPIVSVTALEDLIRSYFYSGHPERLTKKGLVELKRLLKKSNIAINAAQTIRESIFKVESELKEEFIQSTKQNIAILDSAKAALNDIFKTTNTQLSYQQAKVVSVLTDALRNASTMDNWKDAVKFVLQKADMKTHHIETEIRTQQAALDSVVRIASLEKAGSKLRYTGANPERQFCAIWWKKTYTVDEARSITNSFGQPFLYYRGGYNCRHRHSPTD